MDHAREPARPPYGGTRRGPPAGGEDAQAVAAALVARMAGGDATAMEAFYDRLSGDAYRLIRGMVPDPGAAQELLQETMWQAWRLAPRYDPARASVRTWLHVLMRSRVIDWRRRQSVRPAVEPLESDAFLDPGASEEIGLSGDREDLRRAQASLPAAERQILRLTYYRGLTQVEAAAELGIPLGTVKSRVRAALMHLKDAMAGHRRGEGAHT